MSGSSAQQLRCDGQSVIGAKLRAPMSASLSVPQRFLRSTVASYWSLGVRMVVTFGSRVLLARLLIPEDHGVYELALRVVIVASALRDLGLPFHLMRDERKPYGTVFAFSLISGVGMTAALILGAPLAAAWSEGLPAVLRVFAFWVLLDGIAAAPKVFFERELAIGRLVLPEIGRGVVVAGVAIGLALLGWGAWSLVIADLAGAGLFAALVWRRAWGRFPLDVHRQLIPQLLRQSNTLFLVWIALQGVRYVDAFIVGSYLAVEEVGYYTRAWGLAFLVRQVVFPRALVPALVEYRHDPERFAVAFRVGTLFLMFFEVTAGYFLFWNAEKAVAIFLGSQWGPAVALLKVLAFVPFLDVFSELGGEVLKVKSEDRLWLAISLLNLVSLLAFGIAFTREWGALGMAAANLFLVGNLVMGWRMARLFGPAFYQLLGDMLWIYLVPLALLGGVALLLPPASWPRFVFSIVAGLATAGVIWLRFRGLLRTFLAERQVA